jgi:hypothetical protein
MNLTRLQTQKLQKAVDLAQKKLDEATQALEPCLVLLTDAVRATIPRVRSDFPAGAREFAAGSADFPEVVGATGYDADAVVEDLDNAQAIEPLGAKVARLQQMLDDSRLEWLAEAYVPTLELYGVAKVRAKSDPRLARAIRPLAKVFATPRRKKVPTPDK